MERNKQHQHLVCNEDNDVDDGDDDSVGNGVDDGDDDGADDGANKHLAHLSQVTDYCRMERSKQNKHLVCNEEDDGGACADNGDDDNLDKGNDD
eukprot:9386774-Ditylum_brightwellii.AAC.1